jgi:hypothetical protein
MNFTQCDFIKRHSRRRIIQWKRGNISRKTLS